MIEPIIFMLLSPKGESATPWVFQQEDPKPIGLVEGTVGSTKGSLWCLWPWVGVPGSEKAENPDTKPKVQKCYETACPPNWLAV